MIILKIIGIVVGIVIIIGFTTFLYAIKTSSIIPDDE